MRSLSYWASQHAATARLLVIAGYLLVNVLGILLGIFLFPDHSEAPGFPIGIAMLLTPIAFFAYPQKAPSPNYSRRKFCDIALCLATLLFVIRYRRKPEANDQELRLSTV